MIEAPEPEAAVLQFLSFQMGGLACAVDLAHVREIVRYEHVTRVPRVASCVRGVINLRGSVVPVIDLAVGFGLREGAVTSETCLLMVDLMVGGERSVMGVVAESVSQVLELRGDELEPVPAFGTPIPAAALVGLARSEGGFTLVLDVQRLMAEGTFLNARAAGERAVFGTPISMEKTA